MMVLQPRPLNTRADVRALLDDLVDEIRDATDEISKRLEEERRRLQGGGGTVSGGR